jgi:UDP-N-acetylmuramoyl-tripeptide--D-alanyl-D-alanine ligase
MRPRTLAELASRLETEALDDRGVIVARVTTDSRTVHPGDLFVAIRGEAFDGNAFVEDAVASGAAAVVTSRTDLLGTPRIVTTDTLTVLRDLAVIARSDINVPVVAITGSSGKTSTKDLLVAALPGACGSPRSYNNEVGVPLTILGTPPDARFLVAEVGSRGRGHIEYLMPAVRPDVSVVTNLGVVHLETFGTTDELADAKYELIAGLAGSGTAVVPAAEPRLRRDHPGPVITFGTESTADVRAAGIEVDDSGRARFRLETAGQTVPVKLRIAGAHQAVNATAAVAAGLAVGVDLATLASGLEAATGSQWRMEIHRGRFTVVNDAYNANPDSVEAAMRTVAEMPGRHIAVLGTMAELGPVERAEHERIGRLAVDLGFASVVTVGNEPGIAQAAGPIGRNVADAGAAYTVVTRLIGEGDVVLVKASRAVGLEQLALRLAAEVGRP